MSNDQRPIDTLEGKLGCGQQIAQMVLVVIVGLIVITIVFGTLATPDGNGSYKYIPTPTFEERQRMTR